MMESVNNGHESTHGHYHDMELHKLDKQMEVVDTKAWLLISAFAVIILVFVVWGIIGKIPTKMHIEGILIKEKGVRNVSHAYDGRITDIKISPGDYVRKGDRVATIDTSDIIDEINQLRASLNENQKDSKELKSKIQALQEKQMYESAVISGFDGRVIEVKSSRGDYLKRGEPVASVEIGGNSKDLIGVFYIKPEDSQKMTVGKLVEMAPANIRQEEYGFLEGAILSISDYPVTRERMINMLGSKEIVDKFMKNDETLLEVKVDLIRENLKQETMENTSNIRYKWSKGKGPSFQIESGTLCSGEILEKEENPLSLILHGGGH